MAIKVTKFKTIPALVYDHVHMSELRVIQAEDQDSTAQVRITYKMYGVDGDGVKHYGREQFVTSIDDYRQLATTKAMGGDMILANAMASIEVAIAAILAEQGDIGESSVV